MQRRGFFKSLVAVPFLTLATKAGEAQAVKIEPGRYMVFADPGAFDFMQIPEFPPIPGVEMRFIAVTPTGGKSVADTVQMSKLNESDAT